MQEMVKVTDPLQMSKSQLISNETYEAWDDMDDIECHTYKIKLKDRATQLACLPDIKRLIKFWEKEYQRVKKELCPVIPIDGTHILLARDENGKVKQTIDNFLLVMNIDKYFKELRFNEISYSPEIVVDGKLTKWSDADDSKARHYLEKSYGLYSVQKYDDAIRIKFKAASYNPIKDIIEANKWDGTERIATLLHKWLKCENTPYTREVSRLIFAGGIHRLYNPGCKFDDMPVLIGTKQGEGKSTFVRWLSLKDEYFREVNEIDGQKGIEALEGGWICEMSELLALTKSKEVESVKSFLTRVKDNYRRPFDRRVTEHLRQCIFIGTTNKAEFLTDKTGNRRFYPITTYQSGYELFDSEAEIKADILQCWAEAKYKYNTKEMSAYANKELQEEIKQQQSSSVEEDWRVEMILSYIEDINDVCILQLWKEALGFEFTKPSMKDSNEVGLILMATNKWKRATNRRSFSGIGQQRYFTRKVPLGKNDVNSYDEIPF